MKNRDVAQEWFKIAETVLLRRSFSKTYARSRSKLFAIIANKPRRNFSRTFSHYKAKRSNARTI